MEPEPSEVSGWTRRGSNSPSWGQQGSPVAMMGQLTLVLVPSLCLGPAPVGDVLVLSFDLGNDAAQVQVTVVVHGQDDGGVRHLGTELGQLLWEAHGSCTYLSQPPEWWQSPAKDNGRTGIEGLSVPPRRGLEGS